MARQTLKDLFYKLKKLDGNPYGQYRFIRGDWWGEQTVYRILHVQGDPYANPSRIEVRSPLVEMGLETQWTKTWDHQVALADFLHRLLIQTIAEWPEEEQEAFKIARSCSAILPRTACFIEGEHLVLRLGLNLPGADRRIEAERAQGFLNSRLPELLSTLHGHFLDRDALQIHLDCFLRHRRLQAFLEERGLVAFVANGSTLPRETGRSEAPMPNAIPFKSPLSLQVRFEDELGVLEGMGIPKGLSVITGGAFHGKSTLLQALESGVYPRIPGDGREAVAVAPSTWKLRVEEGRPIGGTDLSPFLGALPGGAYAGKFCTPNASGSTSQAANLVEAWESGTQVFLVDEDQSAANFLFKDERMRALVPVDPIRQLAGCAPELVSCGLSFILCQGASGDFLEEADLVLRLQDYQVEDVTAERDRLWGVPDGQRGRDGRGFAPRASTLKSWPAGMGGKAVKVKVRGPNLMLGDWEIQAHALEQLACPDQLRAIGELFVPWIQSGHPVDPKNPEWSAKKLWERLRASNAADLALPRPQEIWAALRRLPKLQFES